MPEPRFFHKNRRGTEIWQITPEQDNRKLIKFPAELFKDLPFCQNRRKHYIWISRNPLLVFGGWCGRWREIRIDLFCKLAYFRNKAYTCISLCKSNTCLIFLYRKWYPTTNEIVLYMSSCQLLWWISFQNWQTMFTKDRICNRQNRNLMLPTLLYDL